MSTILERLRAALAPRNIAVEEEVASGGMGTVFFGRDLALDQALAIKILRPELSGAVATERFQREARTLATLRHPNIVTVHTAGVADGISYYTMDYLGGETLAQRLRAGPLRPEEALSLAHDALSALEDAHRHGVVHRDVKPSNIFLVAGRAVLVDFGISKSVTEPPTLPGHLLGTPEYMAPEQLSGGEVTSRTDLYGLGIVLYESLTGRRWRPIAQLEKGDWTGVPPRLQPVLQRALAWSAQDRWPDAATFRDALRVPQEPRGLPRAVLPSLLAIVVGVVLYLLWPRGPVADLRIDRLEGPDGGPAKHLGDSLAMLAAAQLSGFPDFTVVGPQGGKATSEVRGTFALQGAVLQVREQLGDRVFTATAPLDDWRRIDSVLADSVLVSLFRDNPLDIDLPVAVVPHATEGLKAFLDAEKLFAQGRYIEASMAYHHGLVVDSTCFLCAWRLSEVERWLGRTTDTMARGVALAHLGAFPAPYRDLISADTLPLPQQLARLDSLRHRTPTFLFAPFNYGDELLHRGPLLGRRRLDAVDPFSDALRIRHGFSPAREHLAWLWIAEGDSAAARYALDTLNRQANPQWPSTGMLELLNVAWAWRFMPESQAAQTTQQELAMAGRKGITGLDAGARFMNGFDAPRAAVWLGRRFEVVPEYQRSALIAQVIGWVMLGRTDSARDALGRMDTHIPSPDATLFGDELQAMLILFPETGSRDSALALAAALRDLARSDRLRPEQRGAAAWMGDLLELRFEDPRTAPGSDPSIPPAARQLLRAAAQARRGRFRDALETSQPLTWMLAPDLAELPCLRAALHLLRAEWWQRIGETRRAAEELRWHENSDMVALPVAAPQPMEVDWALGVWGRWQQAGLMRGAAAAQRCPLLRQVADFWSGGEPRWAALSDSARADAAALGCTVHPH
jgi:protein kinase-like protein